MLIRTDVVTPELARAALLDLNVRPENFLPARAADPHASPAFRVALARSQEYARRSLADGTLESYAKHWKAYLVWCAIEAEDPVGEDAPEAVAAHLAWLADGTVDDTGKLAVDAVGRAVRPPLCAATIDLRLAAINKAFELLALPRPGAHPYVGLVVRGIHRTLGVRPRNRRDALDLPLLRTVLESTHRLDPASARDMLLVWLLGQPSTTCGQLARLEWADISFADGDASVAMPWATRSHYPRLAVPVGATGRPGCPVLALETLRMATGPTGPVFAHLRGDRGTGRPMSANGLAKSARRALAGAGRGGREELAVSAEDIAAVAAAVTRPRLLEVRDRALLLTGFASAVRRSNLAAFTWSDCSLRDEGLVLLLRKSKTDQEQAGFEAFVPYGHHELTCPVRHWLAWRDAVAAVVGGDPAVEIPEQAVFCPVDRHGRLGRDGQGRLRQLADESLNRMVARRSAAAGLEGNFGAHSLRAGFITTAYDSGASLVEIAEQSGHKNLENVRVYIRHRDRWRNNPLNRMAV